jgi:hypothetical protein
MTGTALAPQIESGAENPAAICNACNVMVLVFQTYRVSHHIFRL